MRDCLSRNSLVLSSFNLFLTTFLPTFFTLLEKSLCALYPMGMFNFNMHPRASFFTDLREELLALHTKGWKGPHPGGAEEETQGLQGLAKAKSRANKETEALQTFDFLCHHGKCELADEKDWRDVRTEQPADLPWEQLVHLNRDVAKLPCNWC